MPKKGTKKIKEAATKPPRRGKNVDIDEKWVRQQVLKVLREKFADFTESEVYQIVDSEGFTLFERLDSDKRRWLRLDPEVTLGPAYYTALRDKYRQTTTPKDGLTIDKSLDENKRPLQPPLVKAISANEPPRPNRGVVLQFMMSVQSLSQQDLRDSSDRLNDKRRHFTC